MTRGVRAPSRVIRKVWMGSEPTVCDLCNGPFRDKTFVDGATRMGPWAMMCNACHTLDGFGLGTGKGQKYVYEKKTKEWVKVDEVQGV